MTIISLRHLAQLLLAVIRNSGKASSQDATETSDTGPNPAAPTDANSQSYDSSRIMLPVDVGLFDNYYPSPCMPSDERSNVKRGDYVVWDTGRGPTWQGPKG